MPTNKENILKIRMFGVRGLIPSPAENMTKYGGNTSCAYLDYTGNNKILIIDSGSGIKSLGEKLVKSENHDIHIFLTHYHIDHIIGLPFFLPLYKKSEKVTIYGPKHLEEPFEDFLLKFIQNRQNPVPLGEIQCKLQFRELSEDVFNIDDLTVKTKKMNHIVNCIGYRFEANGQSISFTTDHETYFDAADTKDRVQSEADKLNMKFINFIKNSNILVADAQYLPDEYHKYKGWGHSSVLDTVNRAAAAGIKILILFHHDPNREDWQIDKIVTHYRRIIEKKNIDLKIFAAREGWEYLC